MIVDKFGRKPLYIIGLCGMSVMAIGIAITIGHIIDDPQFEGGSKEIVSWIAVAFVLIYVAFFQIGPGPVPWFITSEIFDVADR